MNGWDFALYTPSADSPHRRARQRDYTPAAASRAALDRATASACRGCAGHEDTPLPPPPAPPRIGRLRVHAGDVLGHGDTPLPPPPAPPLTGRLRVHAGMCWQAEQIERSLANRFFLLCRIIYVGFPYQFHSRLFFPILPTNRPPSPHTVHPPVGLRAGCDQRGPLSGVTGVLGELLRRVPFPRSLPPLPD